MTVRHVRARARHRTHVARVATLGVLGFLGLVATAPVSAQESLSFARYRAEIEPIFTAPRGGHGPGVSPCVGCHVKSNTPLKLQPLNESDDGGVYWTEAESRQNFEVVGRLVVPGEPNRSRLLRKALTAAAGGTAFHVGGKFFDSRDDPEWRVMEDWVLDARSERAESDVPPTPPTLDFDFFQSCVQQVFLSKREGRMECVHCHGGGSRGFASTLPEDRSYWNEDESQRNFTILSRFIDPGYPLQSRFLMHPLAPEAGGDHYHSGGRRWDSQEDPEWRMLAAWVRGDQGAACTVG